MSLLAALIPVVALGTAPVAAVPPPPEQVAANCDAPTYASDMLVCFDADLRVLDARMREAWVALDFANVVTREAWVEALRRVALRPGRQGTEASCPGAAWGHSLVRVRAPESGALAIEDDAARVLAAATPPSPGGAWSPYVEFKVDGSVIQLATMEGSTVVCTLIAPR
jgi:hypothetical protein